jgi:uncharacterized protein (TIRG00374 family)
MEPSPFRRWLQVGGSLLLSLLLLLFVFRQASLGQVLQVMASLHWEALAAAAGLALASYTARAYRWGLLLAPTGKAPVASLLGCTAAGFATSTLLPARLGELLRPLLLSSRTGLPPAATLASIVAERLLDLLTVVSLFALAWLRTGSGQKVLGKSLAWSGASLLVLGFSLYFLVRYRERIHELLQKMAKGRWTRRLASFVQEILASLALWGDARHAALLGLWSLITWALVIGQVAVTAKAFGLPLGVSQATLVLAISVVGLAVPTPGGVGGFHAAVQFALLQVAHWPMAEATAYALIHHALCFFPVTLVGIGYMLAVGVSFRSWPKEPPPQ